MRCVGYPSGSIIALMKSCDGRDKRLAFISHGLACRASRKGRDSRAGKVTVGRALITGTSSKPRELKAEDTTILTVAAGSR